jgi:hypothetical protein
MGLIRHRLFDKSTSLLLNPTDYRRPERTP